jgi:hypothetical protein
MDLSKIFSISGKPSLQKLVASAKNGVIVESLDNKKRFHANANNKISCLQDITIFTTNDDVTLKEVLLSIAVKNDFKNIEIPEKDKLFSVFANYLPNFDAERVYHSDVKKIFSWYNILITAGEINIKSVTEVIEENENNPSEEVETKAKKEVKKTVNKTVKNDGAEKVASKPAAAPKAKKTNQKSK